MTEALAVVDSLRTASSQPVLTNESSLTLALDASAKSDRKVLPLKMALFNLQKYIKEGEFVVEFMIKGGLKLLIGLLERRAGGLTGNSLAVSDMVIREPPCLSTVRPTRCPRSPRIRIKLGRSYRRRCRPDPPPTRVCQSTQRRSTRDRYRSETRHIIPSLLRGSTQSEKSRTESQESEEQREREGDTSYAQFNADESGVE
jgi:hypothetical protein